MLEVVDLSCGREEGGRVEREREGVRREKGSEERREGEERMKGKRGG